MTDLAELLTDCRARHIRLSLDSDGGVTVDAPQDALTPGLIDQLKAHKSELLVLLTADDTSAPVFRQPDSERKLEQTTTQMAEEPTDPDSPRCLRCGSADYRDILIHEGRSGRRDCARCGRFIDFPMWLGRDDL